MGVFDFHQGLLLFTSSTKPSSSKSIRFILSFRHIRIKAGYSSTANENKLLRWVLLNWHQFF